MAEQLEADPGATKSPSRDSPHLIESPSAPLDQDAGCGTSCRSPSPCSLSSNRSVSPKSPSSRSTSPHLPSPNPASSRSVSPRSSSPTSPSPTYPTLAIQEDSDEGFSGNSDISALSATDATKAKMEFPEENSRRGNRIYRTLTFRRKKPAEKVVTEVNGDNKKSRKYWWSFRFKKKLLQSSRAGKSSAACPSSSTENQNLKTPSCVCMGYKRTEEYAFASDMGAQSAEPKNVSRSSDDSDSESDIDAESVKVKLISAKKLPVLDMSKFDPEDYPADDPDENRVAQRARDMAEGIEVPPNFPYNSALAAAVSSRDVSSHDAQVVTDLSDALQSHCVVTTTYPTVSPVPGVSLSSESHYSEYGSLTPQGTYVPHTIHTQVDYIHCLVPDLHDITNCSFYWGIMDRYEAEKLLDTKPEGTFLLRDSAQEEFLFSVSFRRYGRSLHARIEQWNHHFSFDSHDPGVFSSDTVCGLIEHYKDPSCCMFFEPMLTLPLNRNFPFSLQHMCRSVIGSRTSYDGINRLPLPKALKEYLQYYHYKQKVRVRRFEVH